MPLDQLFSPAFLRGNAAPQDTSEAAAATPGLVVTPPDAHRPAGHTGALRFEAVTHGTPEQFALSTDFPVFADQVSVGLERLCQFATTHRGHVDDRKIRQSLTAFGDTLLTINAGTGENLRFGTRAALIYGPVKTLLDRIGEVMADEATPLPTRLVALQALAEDVNVCADGVLFHLNKCLQSIDRHHSGLLDTALRVSDELMHQAMMSAIRHHHAQDIQDYPGDELHYLTGLQQHIFPTLGRTPPQDSLAKPASSALVNDCRLSLDRVHRPAALVLALADRARALLEDQLGERLRLPVTALQRAFNFDDAARAILANAAQGLSPAYGELPLDVLIDWCEDGPTWTARLHSNSMLLAHHLLRSLEALGVIHDARRDLLALDLRRPDEPPTAATLRTLDRHLIWVEEHGHARSVRIADLPALPARATAPGQSLAVLLNATRTRFMRLDRPLLARTALENAWPDELQEFPPALLLDQDICHTLVGRMDSAMLQHWLTSKSPQLKDRDHRWLQEAMVTHERADLLSPTALREWTPLSLPSTSPHLWSLAMGVANEPMLRHVGQTLIEVADAALREQARITDRAPPSEGDAVSIRAWLVDSLAHGHTHGEPPLSRLLHEKPALAPVAWEVMLQAYEKGLLDRHEFLWLLTGARMDIPAALPTRLCGLSSKEPLVGYLMLLDETCRRVALQPEELVSFFRSHDVGRISGCAFTFPTPDAEGPRILMTRLCQWLLDKRLHPHQWMDMMAIPINADDRLGHNAVAARLMVAQPQSLRVYLQVAATAFLGRAINKEQLRTLLLARPLEAPEIASLPYHLTVPLEGQDLAAAERLRCFMGTLLQLVLQGGFTRLDLLDLLAEPESAFPHPWGAIGQMPEGQLRRTAAVQGFRALIQAGALSTQDVSLLLLGQDPHLHTPDAVSPEPASPGPASSPEPPAR